MNFKISVILAVYNQEKYLKRAVNSLINQTIGFNNLEVIMIDDCSTDNTKSIINEYISKYNNCIGISLSENSGTAGKPRNIGLTHATAEFITFLDPDDTYEPKALELLYKQITQKKFNAVFCNSFTIIDNNKYFTEIYPKDEMIIKYNDKLPIIINTISTVWGAIFSREFIIDHNIKFTENVWFEDNYFSLKFLINTKKVIFLNKYYGYDYYTNMESLNYSSNEKSIMKSFNGLLLLYDYLKKHEKEIDITNGMIITDFLGLFLRTDMSYNKRIKLLTDINIFENSLNFSFQIKPKWSIFLNYLIKNKHFKIASLLSTIFFSVYKRTSHFFIKKVFKRTYKKIQNSE